MKFRKPRKTGRRKNAKTTRSIATKALAIARGEMYYLDTPAPGGVGTTISWAGNIDLVSGIAQGDDNNNRSGNVVTARSLEIRADIWGNGLDLFNGVVVRALLVQDKENTGTAPTVADILQVTGTTQSVVSPYHVDHLPRYNIMMDRVLTFKAHNSLTATTYIPDRHQLIKKIRLNSKLHFTANGATNVYKNALYLVFISDSATNDPQVTWYTRLGYND